MTQRQQATRRSRRAEAAAQWRSGMAERGGMGERGGSQSIMLLLVVVVLLLAAGLVVDGGRQIAAAQVAGAAADAAARAGLNAAAASRIADRPDAAAATRAARGYLRDAGISGTVQLLPGGRLEVTTTTTRPTVYLSLIGLPVVTGRGESTTELVEAR